MPAARKLGDRPSDVLRWPEAKAVMYGADNPITSSIAKDWLGWVPEPEAPKYGNEYLLKDVGGNKIRCSHNIKNRPLYRSSYETYKQEVLRGKWRLNGEPIIIGQTGQILNGQHQLIALILACQEWKGDPETWGRYWPTEPTIQKFVVFGIEETDEIINTMDTCKPRSLADVIYRSEYFSNMRSGERRSVSKMTDYAIKLLWERTGAGADALSLRKTHSEALDFLARHPKLLKMVCHIFEEDEVQKGEKKGHISRFVSPGYASGLGYLMGCSATNTLAYQKDPCEESMDFSNWDKAMEFIVLIASNSNETQEMRDAYKDLVLEGRDNSRSRWSILVNAWNCYVDSHPITRDALELAYSEDKDGNSVLLDCPTIGGLDIGNPRLMDESTIVADDPSSQEIEERKVKIKTKALISKLEPKMAGDDWASGDVAWVDDETGAYIGQLIEEPFETDAGEKVIVRADDGEWEVLLDNLYIQKPTPRVLKSLPPMRPKPPKPLMQKPKLVEGGHKVGALRWVREEDGEHWRGKIVEVLGNNAKMKVEQGFQGTGTIRAVRLSQLSATQPSLEG